ncbi:MAG: type II toxin-antitoxin system VapC family toxin [Lachnospiraceae bacterium]|nr:type II toxin-antitoxin system VapC family toxin [Lachnospiraceae bacterium]
MLDTNICIYILKKNQKLLQKFYKCKFGDIGISSIVYSELISGVEKSLKRDENLKNLLKFLSAIIICDYDIGASNEYGKIRFELEKKGNIIGPMDMLIAAHAKYNGSTLVTNNEHEFQRVKGLKVVNWVT